MAKNIFEDVPKDIPEELIEVIAGTEKARFERIISHGHSSPKGFWFDQDKNEFVILLKGKASIILEEEDTPVILKPGDYLDIKAHVRHRVEWTDEEEETIWLAVHY